MLLPQGKMRFLMSGVVGTENYSRTTNKQTEKKLEKEDGLSLCSNLVWSNHAEILCQLWTWDAS